jgi:hypothetical protein
VHLLLEMLRAANHVTCDRAAIAAAATAAAVTLLLLCRLWSRDDGSLVASPSVDAVEQAAEAVMCTTCHSECCF